MWEGRGSGLAWGHGEQVPGSEGGVSVLACESLKRGRGRGEMAVAPKGSKKCTTSSLPWTGPQSSPSPFRNIPRATPDSPCLLPLSQSQRQVSPRLCLFPERRTFCHVLGRCARRTLGLCFCPRVGKDTSIREMMFLQEIRLSFSNLMSFSEMTHECRIQLTLTE